MDMIKQNTGQKRKTGPSPIPTIAIPDAFLDEKYAAWLKENDPAWYEEYMCIAAEAFGACCL